MVLQQMLERWLIKSLKQMFICLVNNALNTCLKVIHVYHNQVYVCKLNINMFVSKARCEYIF